VTGQACNADDVMNYYDGNTVTAMWNYAQHYAMSDNSFGTTFGPSAPGDRRSADEHVRPPR
jgi:phospholipase C